MPIPEAVPDMAHSIDALSATLIECPPIPRAATQRREVDPRLLRTLYEGVRPKVALQSGVRTRSLLLESRREVGAGADD
jgi:hypothetical protein